MKITHRALGATLAATLLLAGCGGGDDGPETAAADNGDTEEVAQDAEEAAAPTMPDVVGKPVDEATAELEEAGYVVSTGIVRTTEMEPDLVYRSEPAPGQRTKEGQRVTLRVSAEPRE